MREDPWRNSTIERMILTVAEREWRVDEARQRERTKREQCSAQYYFLFAASDQPPTRNHQCSSTPDPSLVFCSGAAITSASLCDAH